MLTDRQKKIMVAIVETYTESNQPEPIGSQALSKHEGLNYSTATLRNEMASLEEMGYLEKTHTSSGRIPSARGYSLYVNELMNNSALSMEMEEQVEHFFEESKSSKKEVAEKLLKQVIDAKDFNYGAVILEKTAFNSRIKKIDFVYLKDRRGIFLLVTDQGLVLTKEVLIPENINVTNIENTVNFLDENLHDVLLNDFKQAKKIEIFNDGFFDYMTNPKAAVEICMHSIMALVEDKKKIVGQFNILNHPEFNDIQKAQEYLECLKNESIYQIVEFDNGPLPVIGSDGASSISVRIGKENKLPVMRECATITCYYQSKSGTGAITVYGPLRMKYRYVIALLNGITANIK